MKKLFAIIAFLFCSHVFAQEFTYHKIFTPANIPGTGGATVSAVYSPSVFKHGGRYYMLFGVSLSCRNGTVARDSIAYAVSHDGVSNWVWMGYLIEPNTSVCLLDTSQWLTGALYQVNDPTVRVQNGQLHVAYTSVFWKYPVNGVECGVIGTATFNLAQFPLQAPTYRNNLYLVPTTAQCQAGGFSRPAFLQTNGATEMWFDSFAQTVSKIQVIGATQLSNANVVPVAGLTGIADLEVFEKDGCLRVLSNGVGGLRQQKYINGAWTAKTQITSNSLQGWDSWQHGSPNYFKDGNIEQIYMSGAVSNGAGWYSSLNIGAAIKRADNPLGGCN
jgi:predicted GH43/DUF377 family glycosyl hydrolase